MTNGSILDKLDPRVANMAREFIASARAAGIALHISLPLVPGDSTYFGYGLAFSAHPMKENGAIDFDTVSVAARRRWAQMGDLARASGLSWGEGRSESQFWWSNGLTVADLKKGKRP